MFLASNFNLHENHGKYNILRLFPDVWLVVDSCAISSARDDNVVTSFVKCLVPSHAAQRCRRSSWLSAMGACGNKAAQTQSREVRLGDLKNGYQQLGVRYFDRFERRLSLSIIISGLHSAAVSIGYMFNVWQGPRALMISSLASNMTQLIAGLRYEPLNDGTCAEFWTREAPSNYPNFEGFQSHLPNFPWHIPSVEALSPWLRWMRSWTSSSLLQPFSWPKKGRRNHCAVWTVPNVFLSLDFWFFFFSLHPHATLQNPLFCEKERPGLQHQRHAPGPFGRGDPMSLSHRSSLVNVINSWEQKHALKDLKRWMMLRTLTCW